MHTLSVALAFFGHFLLWSVLSVGGAIGLLPDMHRYLVVEQHWLSDSAFTSALALGQASPGPNMILFSALLGWQILGLPGALLAAIGLILPSSLMTVAYFRYSRIHKDRHWVRAMHDGMAPITVGLLLSSGWLLARQEATNWQRIALMLLSVVLVVRTRLNPLWLLLAGALLGLLGFI
ncbi:MAG: chromate transporter [Thiomonas sp. 20-64-9]|jgi:chromate transporter|uniref:chromate transporter n=1 Tax=unclassified Thiomonas TaxID=2625466 RepID=UPI000BCB879F|nr:MULTISPECIES: chromate transporter [unclassified Thiomonas]OYV29579.1 MAG: chromate transporter [Thiomonas sp. 20-64-9]OZB70255.1 MAG: chromate transporter [Thiomonas sp. 13-64-67]